MHTLLIEGHVKPGKKSEFITTWNREILPTLTRTTETRKHGGMSVVICRVGNRHPPTTPAGNRAFAMTQTSARRGAQAWAPTCPRQIQRTSRRPA
jgi:hypothetical protein